MHPDFGHLVQLETDRVGTEIDPERVNELFQQEYVDIASPYKLLKHAFEETIDAEGHSHVTFSGTIQHTDTIFNVSGKGNGPIDAFFNAIKDEKMSHFTFMDYTSHAISDGSDSMGVVPIFSCVIIATKESTGVSVHLTTLTSHRCMQFCPQLIVLGSTVTATNIYKYAKRPAKKSRTFFYVKFFMIPSWQYPPNPSNK